MIYQLVNLQTFSCANEL